MEMERSQRTTGDTENNRKMQWQSTQHEAGYVQGNLTQGELNWARKRTRSTLKHTGVEVHTRQLGGCLG